MSPALEQLIKKMTPEEQEEVETFAAFLLAKRDFRKLHIATDEVSTEEMLSPAERSGALDWLDAEEEDIYSPEEGEEVRWPSTQ